MKPRIITQLLFLAEMQQEQLSETRITGYVEALSDLDEGDVLQAMDRALKSIKYFPRVAEIRELAAQVRRERRRDEEHDARQRETQELIAQGRLRPIMPVALPDPDAPRSNAGPRSFKEIMRAAAAKRKAAEVSSQDSEEGTSSGEP